ncbi:MAG: hypothetical protein K2L21_07045 [Muribaculaceae bacterium]|nr:hypothetical protein [Muribaculaceae bacterium]
MKARYLIYTVMAAVAITLTSCSDENAENNDVQPVEDDSAGAKKTECTLDQRFPFDVWILEDGTMRLGADLKGDFPSENVILGIIKNKGWELKKYYRYSCDSHNEASGISVYSMKEDNCVPLMGGDGYLRYYFNSDKTGIIFYSWTGIPGIHDDLENTYYKTRTEPYSYSAGEGIINFHAIKDKKVVSASSCDLWLATKSGTDESFEILHFECVPSATVDSWFETYID